MRRASVRDLSPVLTPRWLLAHAATVVVVLAMLGLCYWQVRRAAGGNLLSFGYAIEWPAFAAFAVYVWLKEVRQALRATRIAEPDTIAPPESVPFVSVPGREPAQTDSPQPDLARTGSARRREPARTRERVAAAYDDSDDEDLAAYNRYLAWLNAHPDASPSDYPG